MFTKNKIIKDGDLYTATINGKQMKALIVAGINLLSFQGTGYSTCNGYGLEQTINLLIQIADLFEKGKKNLKDISRLDIGRG